MHSSGGILYYNPSSIHGPLMSVVAAGDLEHLGLPVLIAVLGVSLDGVGVHLQILAAFCCFFLAEGIEEEWLVLLP